MKIIRKSFFKNPNQDKHWFNFWVSQIEEANQRQYTSIVLNTSLGITQVWGLNLDEKMGETLVIFPGARTSSLFWDLDRGLDHLGKKIRVFMVETNGLPNLSDGNTPDIKSMEYGEWANEVLERLNIDHAFIAGASFGGLICMKLCITSPIRVKAAFLLNPGCLQPFSLSLRNLFCNLLPIIKPNIKNVSYFLDNAIFHKPNHQLTLASEELLISYELFALKNYKDNTQKPYNMDEELKWVMVDTYLLLGEKDLLFPYKKSINNAKDKLNSLKEVILFRRVGHGIETYSEAIKTIRDRIDLHISLEKQNNIMQNETQADFRPYSFTSI